MPLDAHVAWLREQLRAGGVTHAVYRRGGEELPLATTKGQSEFAADMSDSYVQTDRQLDFLIDPADLVLAGTSFQPRAGDQIDELDAAGGNVVATFAVMSPGGEPPWRWTDQTRQIMRIHTKRLET